MVIVDLPIPGGFALERGELDELVGSKKIEKYQLTPRQAIIYLRGLAPAQPSNCAIACAHDAGESDRSQGGSL